MTSYLWHPRGLSPERVFSRPFVSRPTLASNDWAKVDSLFSRVSERSRFLVLLMDSQFSSLSNRPVTESRTLAAVAAFDVYVLYEPLVPVVVAFDIDAKEVSVVADQALWLSRETGFQHLIDEGRRLLHQGDIIGALVFGIRSLGGMPDF